MGQDENKVYVPELGMSIPASKAEKFRTMKGNGLDITVEHEDINEIEFELGKGSTDHKVSVLHYLHMAGMASIEDTEGKNEAIAENIANAQTEDIRFRKQLQQGDMKGLLKDEEETGYQDRAISRRELNIMDLIYKSMTGKSTKIGDYLSKSHEERLAKTLDSGDKQSFFYQAAMQYASILKTAGITDEKGINEVIDARLGTDFGLFNNDISYKTSETIGSEVYESTTTVDAAKKLAELIREGEAVDMQAIHLDTSDSMDRIVDAMNSNPLLRAISSMRAARALEEGRDSAYAKVWASSFASLTGLELEDSEHVLYNSKDENSSNGTDKKGLGHQYLELSSKVSRVLQSVEDDSARYNPEIRDMIHDISEDRLLKEARGSNLHPETRALFEDYIALIGIDDAEAKSDILEGKHQMKWRSLEGISYGFKEGNAAEMLDTMNDHAEAVLTSYGATTASGDDGLPRLLAIMELERKSRVEGEERVSKFAESVGRKMSSGESRAEKEFIDSFGKAFGLPEDTIDEARKLYKERQTYKNGEFTKVLSTYSRDEAEEALRFGSAEMPSEEQIIAMMKQPMPESRANPLAKAMEAAVLISMDVKDHYDSVGLTDEYTLEDCMTEVVGSMGGMMGLPVDDQTNLVRRFRRTGEIRELVGKLMRFKDMYAETKSLKERDAYGLISADVDFARGQADSMDLNHVWGTMHLYAMAAKAAYCEGERATIAPGAKHMDRPDINDGAMVDQHLDPIMKHLYTNKRKDITRFESGYLSDKVKEKVLERDELISQAVEEIAAKGIADMSDPKYRTVRDDRMPEGLPVEIVRLFGSMQSLYGAILKDGKYEAEEAYLLTQALPMIGIRDPETIDKIGGISFPGSMEVQRDGHGRIGMMDQGLAYMRQLSASQQYRNVTKALDFAGVTDMQKAE